MRAWMEPRHPTGNELDGWPPKWLTTDGFDTENLQSLTWHFTGYNLCNFASQKDRTSSEKSRKTRKTTSRMKMWHKKTVVLAADWTKWPFSLYGTTKQLIVRKQYSRTRWQKSRLCTKKAAETSKWASRKYRQEQARTSAKMETNSQWEIPAAHCTRRPVSPNAVFGKCALNTSRENIQSIIH